MSNRSNEQASKVPVTKRALLQRINRRLAKDGEQVRASRSAHNIRRLGLFFRINDRDVVTEYRVDLESLGRELGALAAWEVVS